MPELLALVVFIAVLFGIEFWYAAHNEQTISEHVQRLNDRLPKQIIAGIFFLLGSIAGWFIAHFTDAVQ